ncbi:NADP-dependent oxidoreductase [Pokkaliibacter sp. CJK22405]|uniref:NADP-dependent oxidoreductase n=1 Tax=Pokkaliibacter sp. CJK22405 TaxID=3384615 RepID=UPI003984A947
MKSIRIHAFGGTDVLQIDEVPTPLLEAGNVIVHTRAAGVNPIDWKTRQGGGAAMASEGLPLVLGWEMSGVVDSASAEVSIFQPGDAVMGLLNFPSPGRCYAEEVSASAGHLIHKPDNLSFAEAAALPLAGLTAWQALYDQGHLREGMRVVILAAAGGVGHLACQIALAAGAEVIAVASASHHDYLRSLGIKHCVDYHTTDVAEMIQDADIVLDGVGGSTGAKAARCLSHNGILVTLPSRTAEEVIEAVVQQGHRATGLRVAPSHDQLESLLELTQDRKLKIQLEHRIPFEEVARAHTLSESGRTRGKIVLTFKE